MVSAFSELFHCSLAQLGLIMNQSKIRSVPTTVCVEEVMKVLQWLLNFYRTWTGQLLRILSEAKQHVDLQTGYR